MNQKVEIGKQSIGFEMQAPNILVALDQRKEQDEYGVFLPDQEVADSQMCTVVACYGEEAASDLWINEKRYPIFPVGTRLLIRKNAGRLLPLSSDNKLRIIKSTDIDAVITGEE